MKLLGVGIHNFRGAADLVVTFKDYSLLVGPNNAGKSTVIDAIRAFYEQDGFKFRPDVDFPCMPVGDKESWVELGFALSAEEHDSLPDEYQNDSRSLRVRKYFQTDRKIEGKTAASGLIFGYKPDGTLAEKAFYATKNVQVGKFGTLVYIPAISRADEYTKLSGPSALRDLLTGIMTDVVEGGDAHRLFTESVDAFSKSVRSEKTDDDRSLAGLEAELNSMLASWDTKFSFEFPPLSAAQIIKSMLDYQLIDTSHGRKQPIESFGSGFQRHLIYSLIQLGAQYAGARPVKKEKDFTPSMNLVLFEEPEAFLHPPQQEILSRSLIKLAQKDQWQVLCATHSPNFVSKRANDIPAIVRLRRQECCVEAFQITDATWKAIVAANQEVNDIAANDKELARTLQDDDMKAEMEVVKHFLWLNPDRSSLFFANHVLVVEGPTEVALINRLIGDSRIANADCGLHVLDCIGKLNMHRFMNLLSSMGISHSVIYDDDNDRSWHASVNLLIQATAKSRGTLMAVPVTGELETMLGIRRAGSDHRKPQHVLYLYETKQIPEASIEAFCRLVESCLPGKASPPIPVVAARAAAS